MRRRHSPLCRHLGANDWYLIIEEDGAQRSVAKNTALRTNLLDRAFNSELRVGRRENRLDLGIQDG